MKIVIKKGLDIPISGKPVSDILLPQPKRVSLNLEPFSDLRFKVLVKPGDYVKIGSQLLENKAVSGQFFVSPAGGTVEEVRRGEKRRVTEVIITLSEKEEFEEYGRCNSSRDEIISHLLRGGIFPHIRQRPFDLIADPTTIPRDIFVHALESLPFLPSAEQQLKGHENYFQAGLNALKVLTTGKVHLVYSDKTTAKEFLEAKNVEKHPAKGPHPISTPSLHIHTISPIRHAKDKVWTLNTTAVIAVGKMVMEGRYHFERVLSIAGTGIQEEKRGFFKGRQGYPISILASGKSLEKGVRFISGDPITGSEVNEKDFLHFFNVTLTALLEDTSREPFHFFGLGLNKYSATKAYLTGHIKAPPQGYNLSTKMHGEERAFVDPAIYDKVMPMRIPTMFLVRAILAENFELAETLGLFEVTSEDFALPTFICPSKIEMMEIVKQGLLRYAKEN